MIIPVGPLVNALAIICGGMAGMAVGSKLPERVRTIVFQGLGLCTLAIGVKMALASEQTLILIFSILIGALLGEFARLEDRLLALGDKLKAKLKSANPRFTEGLVNATVLFCIGAMAILGSFDEGLRGDRTIVFSKSIMDGFASIALGSAFGLGVCFAAIPVFIYQGLLVVFASLLQPWLSQPLMNELTAVGGVMIIGIGLNLLNVTQIKLSNMLPAILIVAILSLIFL